MGHVGCGLSRSRRWIPQVALRMHVGLGQRRRSSTCTMVSTTSTDVHLTLSAYSIYQRKSPYILSHREKVLTSWSLLLLGSDIDLHDGISEALYALFDETFISTNDSAKVSSRSIMSLSPK